MKKILSLLFLFGLLGLAISAEAFTVIQKMGDVTVANPSSEQAVKDASDSVAKKDFSFRAIYGFAVDCPGVNDTDAWNLLAKYGYRGISGTSDSPKDQANKQFQDKAQLYAETYNKIILTVLKGKTE